MSLGHIVVYKKDTASKPFELSVGDLKIGSAATCLIRLKVKDSLVSSVHAILTIQSSGVATIVNKSTAAPIKVNGKITDGPTILQHEDKFSVVDQEFQYFNEALKNEQPALLTEKKKLQPSHRHSVMPLSTNPIDKNVQLTPTRSMQKKLQATAKSATLIRTLARRSLMLKTPNVRSKKLSGAKRSISVDATEKDLIVYSPQSSHILNTANKLRRSRRVQSFAEGTPQGLEDYDKSKQLYEPSYVMDDNAVIPSTPIKTATPPQNSEQNQTIEESVYGHDESERNKMSFEPSYLICENAVVPTTPPSSVIVQERRSRENELQLFTESGDSLVEPLPDSCPEKTPSVAGRRSNRTIMSARSGESGGLSFESEISLRLSSSDGDNLVETDKDRKLRRRAISGKRNSFDNNLSETVDPFEVSTQDCHDPNDSEQKGNTVYSEVSNLTETSDPFEVSTQDCRVPNDSEQKGNAVSSEVSNLTETVDLFEVSTQDYHDPHDNEQKGDRVSSEVSNLYAESIAETSPIRSPSVADAAQDDSSLTNTSSQSADPSNVLSISSESFSSFHKADTQKVVTENDEIEVGDKSVSEAEKSIKTPSKRLTRGSLIFNEISCTSTPFQGSRTPKAASKVMKVSNTFPRNTPDPMRLNVEDIDRSVQTPEKLQKLEEAETPKSHMKSKRKTLNRSTYNPIVEDVTPVSPKEMMDNEFLQTSFKTPDNTPGLFDEIRESVIKSRKSVVNSKKRPRDSSLLKTAKKAKVDGVNKNRSPSNRLSNFEGVRRMLRTPAKPPLNDLTKVPNLRGIMSPKQRKSPKNDLTNVPNLRRMMSPKQQKTPKNDLTNIPNLRRLVSPKQQNSPKNDLTRVPNLRKIMSPKEQKSPENDLTRVPNLRRIMSPKEQNSPTNDLRNISGILNIFNVSGVEPLHQQGSDIENSEDLFTQITGKKPVKAYQGRGHTLSPIKHNNSTDNVFDSPRVEQWVQEQAAFESSGNSNLDSEDVLGKLSNGKVKAQRAKSLSPNIKRRRSSRRHTFGNAINGTENTEVLQNSVSINLKKDQEIEEVQPRRTRNSRKLSTPTIVLRETTSPSKSPTEVRKGDAKVHEAEAARRFSLRKISAVEEIVAVPPDIETVGSSGRTPIKDNDFSPETEHVEQADSGNENLQVLASNDNDAYSAHSDGLVEEKSSSIVTDKKARKVHFELNDTTTRKLENGVDNKKTSKKTKLKADEETDQEILVSEQKKEKLPKRTTKNTKSADTGKTANTGRSKAGRSKRTNNEKRDTENDDGDAKASSEDKSMPVVDDTVSKRKTRSAKEQTSRKEQEENAQILEQPEKLTTRRTRRQKQNSEGSPAAQISKKQVKSRTTRKLAADQASNPVLDSEEGAQVENSAESSNENRPKPGGRRTRRNKGEPSEELSEEKDNVNNLQEAAQPEKQIPAAKLTSKKKQKLPEQVEPPFEETVESEDKKIENTDAVTKKLNTKRGRKNKIEPSEESANVEEKSEKRTRNQKNNQSNETQPSEVTDPTSVQQKSAPKRTRRKHKESEESAPEQISSVQSQAASKRTRKQIELQKEEKTVEAIPTRQRETRQTKRKPDENVTSARSTKSKKGPTDTENEKVTEEVPPRKTRAKNKLVESVAQTESEALSPRSSPRAKKPNLRYN